jgi:epoxide hydrolase-like predicted phosphatase
MLEACMGSSVRPEMISLIEEVKAAGYQTGLLTNIFAERRVWLHRTFPPSLIDVYGDSSEMGLRKPDPRIYVRLLELLRRAPEEVAFVDDFAENLTPAAEMGMATILFSDVEKIRDDLRATGVKVGAVERGGAR